VVAAGQQALLVLAHLRKGGTLAELASGFGIGTATAWRYVTETVGLLAARSPKLRKALRDAKKAGHAYVVIDGTLIPIDRVAADRPFYSGKHHRHDPLPMSPRSRTERPDRTTQQEPANSQRPRSKDGIVPTYPRHPLALAQQAATIQAFSRGRLTLGVGRAALTIVNIALPSAQRSLHFATVDRQWAVTAYALAFGSLLLLGGRLADLFGRKVTFMAGLAGFAVASAAGGASVNFAMLVTARACQGAFAAMMAPSALSILASTFADPKERGKAFGVFGAISGAGGAVGLVLGGVLTEYLSWRWALYVNLFFAGVALAGAAVLLRRQPARGGQRLDVPGAVLVGGAMLCLVYGLGNAAAHSWDTPSTWGFLAVGVAGLAAFAAWQARAKHALLPPRVLLNRNRGGAYLAMLFSSAGVFGIFLFLAFYLQTTLGYSPLVTGLAFLPLPAALVVSVNAGQIVLMPRTGPKPLVGLGLLIAAGGMVWLTRIGAHSGYASAILGPLLVTGLGLGQVVAPALNTGTYGVAPYDAGVAAATINAGQQLGGSIGTALLNTVVASATAAYLASHLNPRTILAGHPGAALVQQSLVHGYAVGFWWTAGVFAAGAVVCGTLLRRGPLRPRQAPAATAPEPQAAQPEPPSVQLNDQR
jgi:EmrB/QacA subfamily drug resistance transporter